MFPRRYRKVGAVLAARAEVPGVVRTPEGDMRYAAGDYLVTDLPPTHCWPVRREVFEATYDADDRPVPLPGEVEGYFARVGRAKAAAPDPEEGGSGAAVDSV